MVLLLPNSNEIELLSIEIHRHIVYDDVDNGDVDFIKGMQNYTRIKSI